MIKFKQNGDKISLSTNETNTHSVNRCAYIYDVNKAKLTFKNDTHIFVYINLNNPLIKLKVLKPQDKQLQIDK